MIQFLGLSDFHEPFQGLSAGEYVQVFREFLPISTAIVKI